MKLSLIVLGALSVSSLMRRRSAALRHWVLAAAVGCAAAVPALEAVVPVWRLPVSAPAVFERYVDTSRGIASDVLPRRASGSQRDARPGSAPVITSDGQFEISALIAPTLGTVWLAGMFVSLSILLVGMLRLRWLAARAHLVTTGRWREIASEIAGEYGIRPPVLLQSEHPSLLVTWGLTRPKVIMPANAGTWSDARARVVLTHELAHIRRGDWIVQMAAELLRAVYWFNPLLWVTCRRLRLESEYACDDEVMTRGVKGSDYATHLVELARALNQRRHGWLPAPAMARPSSLERRVRAMLNDRLNRKPLTGFARAAILATLLAASAGVAAAQGGFVSLAGSVADESGRGIPGTAVLLVNEQRRAKYEVTTNEAGQFEFVGLLAGEYGLEVRGLGFQMLKDVLKVAGQNLQRNIVLKLGTLQETITVTFNPEDNAGGGPQPAPRVKEVPMPARKECVASATGGRIVPPRKIRDVAPVYPLALRGTGIEGTVVMEARIDADGYVADVQIIGDAQPELAQSAIAAVRDWRFTATLLNCEPTPVTMTVTTSFRRMPPTK